MQLKKFLNKILPHEICFTVFVIIVTCRLYLHTGISFYSIIYTLSILIICLWVYFFRNKQTLRLGFFFVLMNIVFTQLRDISPLINPGGKVDAMLQYVDTLLINGNISIMLEPYMSKPLTEVLAFCYMLFMIHQFIACIYYLFFDKKHAKGFYAGLFSLYAFGFLGYVFFPAIGPYITMVGQFNTPVEGYYMMKFLHYMYPKYTNYTDIFPSLHCAVSCFILFFDYRYHKLRFNYYLLPCLGLWFSTVYLRYHYFIDCVAGFTLAIVVLIFTKIYMDRTERKGVV